MTATVTLVPGDGIGPEVTQATVRLLGAILMLCHLDQTAVAERVERAIHGVYDQGRHLTRDVGGSASTDAFTQTVIDVLR